LVANLISLAADRKAAMSKYLTYEERLAIEAGLKENLSFGTIAKKLEKAPSYFIKHHPLM
jgi:IS30 family transposase